MSEYHQRDIRDAVITALENMPVVVVTGMRQTGKTTFLCSKLKSAARWQERDLAGLKAFLAATPHCKAGILCHSGEDAVQLGQRLWALPTSLVLS